ncbi:MAG TPA: hypothetical protein VFN67_03830 [Polyangiales bacterium]|nr:hypothetical protein [Polyangiales bacterium]
MSQTSASSSVSIASSFEDPNIPPELAQASSADLPAELSEFARLEALLFARTRSHGSLQRELERRDRLFREALVRMSTSTSQELSALRAGYDAAVARAIEAEVAKAELTFALDETRSQLTAAQPAAGVGTQIQAPGVYAAGADLDAARWENAELRRRLEALKGELNGVRARAVESEQAWQSAVAQGQKLQQRMGTTQQRVDELRTESAELTLLAQTRAARIAELTQAAAFEQQEIRTLRAQVTAATAAQAAQDEAREADRQLWSERLRQHEEREQAATSAVARSEEGLREFLGTIEQPLRELDASLDALDAAGATSPGELESPAAQSGTRFDVSATQPPPAAESKAPSARRRS